MSIKKSKQTNKPKFKSRNGDRSWRDDLICHQCKEPMNYDLCSRVPVVGMPGVSWTVCSRKCAVILAEATGVQTGDKT